MTYCFKWPQYQTYTNQLQYHRIEAEVARIHWKLWCSTHTAQAGPPIAHWPGPFPNGFWIFLRMVRPQTPRAIYGITQSFSQQKVLPDVHRKHALLCLSLFPLPLVLSLRPKKVSLVLFSLHAPFRYLWTLVIPPLSLFFSRLNGPSSLSLLIVFAIFHWTHSHISMSLLYWEVQN